MSIMCRIDDKDVPLYRVIWVSAVPHFCGEEDCTREGYYEIRLEQGESVWGCPEDRDKMVGQLELWQGGLGPTDGFEPGDEPGSDTGDEPDANPW